ncbi:MAG: MgtC/SapB family protein [Clostridia bacterium]|nr:MgtC/SapB family protein [Clostridia bacterium]
MTNIELPFWETVIRLLLATVCGGVIGIERGRKHRPAGFRTHMIVCIGAALTMVLSIYISAMFTNVWSVDESLIKVDVSRLGAQVINGIGFLGAGTIIVTGRQQIKGLTTAAGLWASACMGLAIGAGFYIGALVACLLIIITVVLLTKLESFILAHSRNVNMYIEFENMDDVALIVSTFKEQDVKVFDVEISKQKSAKNSYPNAIFSLLLPKKKSHDTILTIIAQLDTVRTIEEL